MKKRTNILYVTDSSGVSGAEFVILDIMENLDKERFTPTVFCHERNEALLGRLRDLGIDSITTSHFPHLEKVGGPGASLSKIFAYLVGVIKIGFELISLLKSRNINLIYANAYPSCIYCVFPSIIAHTPFVWHVHNIRRIHAKNFLIYRIVGMVCSKIVTVSDACKRNLLKAKIDSSKIVTIYNGMNLQKLNADKTGNRVRKELGLGQSTKIIGLFGQPIPEKGHQYFIEAASEVVTTFPDSVFLIVGYLYESDYQKTLFSLVDELGLSKHVMFTGWRQDIPEVMASIDVLAHTRVTPEPAALVLMEAMAMGKPIVASNTGGTPELVIDTLNGIIVPPGDSGALAKGILYLLENPQKAKQMGLYGRTRVERNFTLKNQINRIEDLVEKLTDGKSISSPKLSQSVE